MSNNKGEKGFRGLGETVALTRLCDPFLCEKGEDVFAKHTL